MQAAPIELREMSKDLVLDIDDGSFMDGSTASPEILREVGEIKTLMSLIRRSIKDIQEDCERQNWTASIDSKKSQALEKLLEATNASALQARNKLRSMKEEADQLPAESEHRRTRMNVHAILSKKFISLLQEYHAVQNDFREKYKVRVRQQFAIVQPGASREQLDEILVKDNNQHIDRILSDSKHLQARNALLSIQEQKRDIHHLEKSIQELDTISTELSMATSIDEPQIEQLSKDFPPGQLVRKPEFYETEEYRKKKLRRKVIVITGATLSATALVVFIVWCFLTIYGVLPI